MTSSIRFSRFATVLFFAACAGIGAASAADFPTRPMKWVEPYPLGGNNIGTVMVVTNSLLVKTVVEFIAYCKANAEVNRALADPKMRERLAALGGLSSVAPIADFGKMMQDETDKWAKVVAASGASID